MKDIKMRKGTERLPVDFRKEMYIRTFKEIVHKFNKAQNLDGIIEFAPNELVNLKIVGYKEMDEFMDNFHSFDSRKECFHVLEEEWIIRGGMFTSKVTLKDKKPTKVEFAINAFWKDYFYSKMDLELWYKHKGSRKKLKELVKEEKAPNKILEVMSDCINHDVKGKYSQRLLSLLNGMKGSNLFIMKWENFKLVMEIPKSYKASNIDQRIFEPCKEELLKANIKITKIEKIKKGRSIDKIIIQFKNLEDKKEVIKVKEPKALSPEEILVEKTLTKLFLKMNGYTLRDLGDVEINSELREFIEENK